MPPSGNGAAKLVDASIAEHGAQILSVIVITWGGDQWTYLRQRSKQLTGCHIVLGQAFEPSNIAVDDRAVELAIRDLINGVTDTLTRPE